MEHKLEVYKIWVTEDRLRWGCRCSCDWQARRYQMSQRFAYERGQEHIDREERRVR